MKAPEGYRLWLRRRIEEGNDLARVRRQIEAWKAKLPEGLTVHDLDAMLTELDGVMTKGKPSPKPAPKPTSDVDAFD